MIRTVNGEYKGGVREWNVFVFECYKGYWEEREELNLGGV
jgi:hypothetical protein